MCMYVCVWCYVESVKKKKNVHKYIFVYVIKTANKKHETNAHNGGGKKKESQRKRKKKMQETEKEVRGM